MGQPGAEMVALVEHEDLCLVCEAAKRWRVNDAVAVAAELTARGRLRLEVQPAAAPARIGRVRGACCFDNHLEPRLTRAVGALNYWPDDLAIARSTFGYNGRCDSQRTGCAANRRDS